MMKTFSEEGFLFAELAVVSTVVVAVTHVLVCLLFFIGQCTLLDGVTDLVAAQSFTAGTIASDVKSIIEANLPGGSSALGLIITDSAVTSDSGGIGDVREVRCSVTYYPVYFEFKLGHKIIRPPAYRREKIVLVTIHRPAAVL